MCVCCVQLLQQLLDTLDGSSSSSSSDSFLDLLPEEFTRVRLPDVHALVWLDENARAFRGQMVSVGERRSHFPLFTNHTFYFSLRYSPRVTWW